MAEPQEATAGDAAVGRLIFAYRDTYRTLAELPRVFFVRWGSAPISRQIRAVRLKSGCHYFLTPHVHARLDALARRMNERLALDPGDKAAKEDLERISSYRASLAPPPFKRLVALYGVLVALTATLIAGTAFPGVKIGKTMTDFEGDLLSLNMVKAFAIARDDPDGTLLALVITGSALALIVFRAAGLTPPHEFPHDVALQALRTLILVPFWIVLAIGAVVPLLSIALPHVPSWTVVVVIVGFAGLALLRIQDLRGVYRARHRPLPRVAPGFVAAGTGRRVAGACVDVLVALTGGLLLGAALSDVGMNGTLYALAVLFVLFPFCGVAHALIAHKGGGETLGKRAAGTEVVQLELDARPSRRTLLKRESFKWFVEIGPSSIVLLPLLATIVATLRDPDDRARHDKVAETVVRDCPAAQTVAGAETRAALEVRPA